MATGQPYLAAWTAADATLRLYQMAANESAFVQVATVSLPHSLSLPDFPYFEFNVDSSRLVAYHVADPALATSPALDLYNLALQKLDTKNAPQNTGTTTGFFSGMNDDKNSTFLIQNKNNGISFFAITASAIGGQDARNPGNLFTGDFNDCFIASDGSSIICCGPAGGTNILLGNRVSAGTSPIPFAVQTGAFTPDLRYMMTATKDDSAIVTHEMPANPAGGPNWTELSRVTEDPTIGKPVKLAWRYDSRYLAVAFKDGAGVFTTVIYQRLGAALVKKNTLANFGKTLAFTRDGRYLIDAGSKKAMKYAGSGAWDVADAVMVNLQANVAVAAVSRHVAQPVPDAKIYDSAVYNLVKGTVNLANIKIKLYTGATFFPPVTDMGSAESGATEKFVSAWPQGGPVLQGVTLSQDGSTAPLKFNALEVTINAGGPMTFRQAIIYDATANRPLIFIDYGQDITIEANTTMVVNSAGGPMVRFVA